MLPWHGRLPAVLQCRLPDVLLQHNRQMAAGDLRPLSRYAHHPGRHAERPSQRRNDAGGAGELQREAGDGGRRQTQGEGDRGAQLHRMFGSDAEESEGRVRFGDRHRAQSQCEARESKQETWEGRWTSGRETGFGTLLEERLETNVLFHIAVGQSCTFTFIFLYERLSSCFTM